MAAAGPSAFTTRGWVAQAAAADISLEGLHERAEAAWTRGDILDASLYFSVLGIATEDPQARAAILGRLQSIRQAPAIYGYLAGANAKTFVFIGRSEPGLAPRVQGMAEALARLNIQTHCIEVQGGNTLIGDAGLDAELRKIHGQCHEGGMAIAYANHHMGEWGLPLQDFFILYANPEIDHDFALAKYLGEPRGRSDSYSASIIHPENRTRTLFSIVIPTRNGAKYLKHNLRTILEQDFDDYEVVLSDNSEEGNLEIRNLVKEIDSDKIKYHRTERNLDLPDSFEFAHSKTSGEYVFGIGGDDGLLLHGLSMLSSALKEIGPSADVLKYEHMYYGWPDAQPRMFQYFTRIPMRKKRLRISTENSHEWLLDYMNHQASYASLPYGYGEAVLSKRIINTIKKKTGRVFPALAQDLFMGCTVLALTEEFHRLAYPITVWGASANCSSIGTVKGGIEYTRWAHTLEYYSEANRPAKGYYDEYANYCSPYYYHPDVCGFMANDLLFALCSMDLIERKLVPESWIDKINWESYFKNCVNYIYEGSAHFSEIMDQVLEKMKRRNLPELERWFLEKYHLNSEFKGVPVPPVEAFKYGLFENDILYLRGNEFGLETIYDAAVFYRKLTNV